jgi:cell pole-organizing protein PopZ
VTGKTQAARQPSIDDLLTSIRQAIHERVTPDASARSPVPEHASPTAVPQAGAEAGGTKRTIVTGRREGFAGLLGGDVRLEEALARLNQPAWRRAPDAPVAAKPANSQTAAAPAPEPPAPELRLRPTIDDWNTGRAMPAAGRGQREESAAPGAPKRGAAKPADEVRKEGRMHEGHGEMARPTEGFARTPAGAREGAREGERDGELLSSRAASAANSAFSRLTDATDPRSPRAERPLDEMTRDCLRPLLKAWLDENLPGMVERLVREEIARVARRGS